MIQDDLNAHEEALNANEGGVFYSSDTPVLHHVCLFVSDMSVSVDFYTSGLGLKVHEAFDDIIGMRRSGEFQFNLASVFLQAGAGRYVELHPANDGEISPPGFPLNHLALTVKDVDAAYHRAIAAGATPFDVMIHEEHWDGSPLNVIMTGQHPEPMRMAFLQGPSGELIELYQATAVKTIKARTTT